MIALLTAEIERRYGWHLDAEWTRLEGGEESEVWRIGDKVIHISPSWRTEAELRWVHSLTLHCARTIPEVVAPIPALDGSTVFTFEDQPVCLFPFIEGETLDTSDDDLCQQAARLLARIHTAGQTWRGDPVRPPSKSFAPGHVALPPDPPELVDAELDAWYERLWTRRDITTGATHGDYYCRNTLAQDGRITGVIDWNDCEVKPLILEVGWSAWEYAQTPEGDELDDERARMYLRAYAEAGGACHEAEFKSAVQAMRWRLRDESRYQLAARARGESWDQEYTEQELRAFTRLRGREL